MSKSCMTELLNRLESAERVIGQLSNLTARILEYRDDRGNRESRRVFFGEDINPVIIHAWAHKENYFDKKGKPKPAKV